MFRLSLLRVYPLIYSDPLDPASMEAALCRRPAARRVAPSAGLINYATGLQVTVVLLNEFFRSWLNAEWHFRLACYQPLLNDDGP